MNDGLRGVYVKKPKADSLGRIKISGIFKVTYIFEEKLKKSKAKVTTIYVKFFSQFSYEVRQIVEEGKCNNSLESI